MNKLSAKISVLYLLLIVLIGLQGCKQQKPDISRTYQDIEIHRFEKDLFSTGPDSLKHEIPYLVHKYGDFLELFSQRIIMIGSTSAPDYLDYLGAFVTDRVMNETYKRTMVVFPDLKEMQKELSTAFGYFGYYFPGRPLPVVYTFISGFNHSIVTNEEYLGIGLDKYLGSEDDFYYRLALSNYQRQKMHPAAIVPDAMRAWLYMEFEFNDSIDNLLSQMIYEGMILHALEKTLPDHPDTLRTGFTKDQLQWCKKNEKQMWTYLVGQRLLFTTDRFTITKFVNEGPFTKDFSNESPARAAVWLARQIVRAYMKKNSHLTLEELMNEKDYQKILSQSGYKP